MEREKTGFSITCNWCGYSEVIVKPINEEMCVIECHNPECMETTHFLNVE